MKFRLCLYRVHKVSVQSHSVFRHRERNFLGGGGYTFFHADEVPACKTIINNLVPVTSMIRCYDKFMLADKLCEEYNLMYNIDMEDRIYFSSHGPNGGKLSYHAPDDNVYEIEMTQKEINQYMITKKNDEYMVWLELLSFQTDGLTDKGWELMACENGDYTDNYEAVKAMVDEGGLSYKFIYEWVDGETVFHPCWQDF